MQSNRRNTNRITLKKSRHLLCQQSKSNHHGESLREHQKRPSIPASLNQACISSWIFTSYNSSRRTSNEPKISKGNTRFWIAEHAPHSFREYQSEEFVKIDRTWRKDDTEWAHQRVWNVCMFEEIYVRSDLYIWRNVSSNIIKNFFSRIVKLF